MILKVNFVVVTFMNEINFFVSVIKIKCSIIIMVIWCLKRSSHPNLAIHLSATIIIYSKNIDFENVVKINLFI